MSSHGVGPHGFPHERTATRLSISSTESTHSNTTEVVFNTANNRISYEKTETLKKNDGSLGRFSLDKFYSDTIKPSSLYDIVPKQSSQPLSRVLFSATNF